MRFQKKPEADAALLLQIGKDFHPEDLSPTLLAQVGDVLLRNNKLPEAQAFFTSLRDEYDRSPLVDWAYKGLGEIAYDNKDYAKALNWYGTALDKGIATGMLKEITIGKAKTLLALNDFEKAKALFEEIASNRQWRGAATALSVYSLGQIEFAQQHWAEANAFYQRVFVGYQKWPDIQAKAYLGSGQCFEKLAMNQEAVKTYSEMLRNEKLKPFPETQEASQRLQKLQGAPTP